MTPLGKEVATRWDKKLQNKSADHPTAVQVARDVFDSVTDVAIKSSLPLDQRMLEGEAKRGGKQKAAATAFLLKLLLLKTIETNSRSKPTTTRSELCDAVPGSEKQFGQALYAMFPALAYVG